MLQKAASPPIPASADYIRLERGEDPTPVVTKDYFTDAPPGCDPAASLHLGLFTTGPAKSGPGTSHLAAIAEMSFGFPTAQDAYLGLMIVDPALRGTGAGVTLLRHVEDAARARGKTRMYLGVLDANPRGRAFWDREGFAVILANRPVTIGQKTQLAHRMVKPL